MKETHRQHALHVANMRALLALFKRLDSGANPLRKKSKNVSRNEKPGKRSENEEEVRPSVHSPESARPWHRRQCREAHVEGHIESTMHR